MRPKTSNKLNYLSETKSLIKSALIAKGQTVEDSDTFRSYADKILAISGGSGGSTNADLFPLQPVEGFIKDTNDLIGTYYVPTAFDFVINEGENYCIEWDGVTYNNRQAVAITLSGTPWVYLGNASDYGYPGNGEPFIITYNEDAGGRFVALNDRESHTIRIYQQNNITVKPLIAMTNGKYSEDGVAYSPVTVSVAGGGGTVDFPFDLKEILPPTPLTFEAGVSELFPNTPVAIIADENTVANIDIINNGESGLVIWDDVLYAVYAGQRNTAPVQFNWGASTMSINGAIGNISIPSNFQNRPVVEETASAGKSTEPFLIVANTQHGFQVAIPEDSTEFTHTLQIFKFTNTEVTE